MNKISKELVKIAEQLNGNVQIIIQGINSGYAQIPWEKSNMDAEQIVTYILKMEKQLKNGFESLEEDFGISNRYYGVRLVYGQLFMYYKASTLSFAKSYIEEDVVTEINEEQVKEYIQYVLKESFPNISVKISDTDIKDIVRFAEKELAKKQNN